MTARAPKGFDNVLDRCLAVRPGEQVVLLTDEGSDGEVVERLVAGIEARRGVPVISRIPMPPAARLGTAQHGRRGHARGGRRDRAHEPVHRFEPGPPRRDAGRRALPGDAGRPVRDVPRRRTARGRLRRDPRGRRARGKGVGRGVDLPPDDSGRHRPARFGPGKAREGPARPRARERCVHGAAGHRGGDGAGRGLERGDGRDRCRPALHGAGAAALAGRARVRGRRARRRSKGRRRVVSTRCWRAAPTTG